MPQIPDHSYDAILCGGVLEHVDAKESAVAECSRVLTVGGIFLVGVPFAQPLHRTPQDFWRFTEYGLRYMLERAGFQIAELHAIGKPEYPTTYLALAVRL